MDINFDLLKQIEFYLSDENLKRDKFFRNIIKDSQNGYFDIDYILKCNKIKKMNINKTDIVNCINKSEFLELNEENSKLRRINNKELPYDLTKNKVILLFKNEEPEKNIDDDVILIKLGLIKFNTKKFMKKSDIQLESLFSKVLNTQILFVKNKKKEGILIYLVDKVKNEKIEELLENGIQVKKEKYNFYLCEELDVFKKILKENNKKIEMSLKKKFNYKIFKKTSNIDDKKDIKFLDKIYKNSNDLKNIFKNIIIKTINNVKIENKKDNELLFEIIKYHNNFSKFKDIDYFTVDNNKDYPNTRCFYAILKDGNKIDFSFHKCISNME